MSHNSIIELLGITAAEAVDLGRRCSAERARLASFDEVHTWGESRLTQAANEAGEPLNLTEFPAGSVCDLEAINIMVDLETASLSRNAAVTEIGACVFAALPRRTPQHYVPMRMQFHCESFLGYAEDSGLFNLDPKTAEWRRQTTPDAWLRATLDDSLPSYANLAEKFLGYLLAVRLMSAHKIPLRLWAKGADFDFPILGNLMEAAGLKQEWDTLVPYYNRLDCRSVFSIFGARQRGNTHNALEDAAAQAAHLESIMYSCAKAHEWRKSVAPNLEGVNLYAFNNCYAIPGASSTDARDS